MRDVSTRYFDELTPDRIHEAFGRAGVQAQPAVRFLNSLENRVALVSDEDEERWVAKFYRPGRWTREAILEEHGFLSELQQSGLPVVPPVALDGGGETLGAIADIHFAVFPYAHGRPPDELELSHMPVLGELLAHLHEVGARRTAPHRLRITPETWGAANLEWLRAGGKVPANVWPRYERAVQRLIRMTGPQFESVEMIRVHGDCHRGNLLWSSQGPTLVDFDDTATGPPVQDVWMLVPGRDGDAIVLREALLEAYQRRRPFDRGTLRLIEPLRALRYVYYASWLIARRDDPAVRRIFHDVGTSAYWRQELEDLEAQLEVIAEAR